MKRSFTDRLESDLTLAEREKLDNEAVTKWVEGLDADHLYEALVERLAECICMDESEMKGILLEIHERLKLIDEIEDLFTTTSRGSGEILPVQIPA